MSQKCVEITGKNENFKRVKREFKKMGPKVEKNKICTENETARQGLKIDPFGKELPLSFLKRS
jgi:hypothetical protein